MQEKIKKYVPDAAALISLSAVGGFALHFMNLEYAFPLGYVLCLTLHERVAGFFRSKLG
jgi:hypothetical protein